MIFYDFRFDFLIKIIAIELISPSCSSFSNSPFSNFGSYMVEKNRKLQNQFEAEASTTSHGGSGSVKPIFDGVSIFVDGFTVPSSQLWDCFFKDRFLRKRGTGWFKDMLVKGKLGGPSVNLLLLALPGLDLGPSLREICAANRTDEKQQIIALLQSVGTSFCPDYSDWFGDEEAGDTHSRNANKSVLSKFLHSHPADYSTTKVQIVIKAGLLKEGLCSVQDESAGHFILTLIWMRVKLWLPLKKEVDFHKYIFS